MAKRTTEMVNPRYSKETRTYSLPGHLQGYDPEFDVVTFKEGPLKRLLGRKR